MPRRSALDSYKQLVNRDLQETVRDNTWLKEEIEQVLTQNEMLRQALRSRSATIERQRNLELEAKRRMEEEEERRRHREASLRAEEASRLAEQARRVEEQRRADQARIEQERRLAEEERRKMEAERRRLEELRVLEEQRRRERERDELAEEQRRRQQRDRERELAEEERRRLQQRELEEERRRQAALEEERRRKEREAAERKRREDEERERNRPPPVVVPPPQRRQSLWNRSHVRLEIVEAADLHNQEMIGKSDPYCVLHWENHPDKELHRTQIIDNDLNPKWHSTVEADVPDGVSYIALSVFDDDVGKDDFMGYTRIPLSPAWMDDEAKTKGKWLPLLPRPNNAEDAALYQKRKFGKILIRGEYWHIEGRGGPSLDQIRKEALNHTQKARDPDYPNTLILNVQRGENLIPADVGGKSDPYVEIAYNDQPPVAKTDYEKNTLNPTWNKTFKLSAPPEVTHITFLVWDHDLMGSHDFLGYYKWDVRDRKNGPVVCELGPRPDNAEDRKLVQKYPSLGRLYLNANWFKQ